MKPMLTPKDIMEIFGVSKNTAYKMVRQKGFPSIKVEKVPLRNGLKRTKVENLFYLKEKFEITKNFTIIFFKNS